MEPVKATMTTDKAEEPVTTTCSYWVPRKKRRCKMTANKGSEFCGAHAPTTATTANSDDKSGEVSFQERIPCPLDHKHTVFKRKLAKHLTICNARDQESSLPYIVKGVNSGEDLKETDEEFEKFNQIKLHELSDEEFYSLIDTVKELYDKHINSSIQELQLEHESLKEELSRKDYGQETLRQLTQASSLLGILEHDHQLTDHTSYVEFGAGKGQLAYFLATVLQEQKLSHSQVVLIDRMSLRHKKDNKLANRDVVQRIRADIADLKFSALPELKKTQRTVALSKHLCGAATDLTLRCILGDGNASSDYVLIALCCHHRCSWRSYVGRKFLQEAGIGAREFAILTKMVSWAVCGTGLSRERRKAMESADFQSTETNTQRLTRQEREQIGQQCKRVLDYGRLDHLRSHGYQAELKFYVPRDVTLENVVLLAKPTSSKLECQNK
ncbi:tRNA:m(4)X modification enzyme TRM13 homolog [Drosophila sechellia]|uniref:tRNA:m(4)X modification enzyme TRM13 n=1 Tax=Drosophila sechellia TaxID=7238 RepID=B4I4E9_DROSE|nr:tRNA:m(4)X modification enzyme TRM13 homolog [Drosophila sechellia]EDW55092.1 GM10888 [Drosophila sechellia]